MKKVLFHTGRGGRFNNAGHVTDDGIYHLDNQTTWKDFKNAN